MNKIVTALNFIDDELIVSAFESMRAEGKTSNGSMANKKPNTFKLYPKRWIAVFTSFLLVVCLAPIVYFSLPNSSEGPSYNQAVSIYQLYGNSGYHSFAKLTASSIGDDIYCYADSPQSRYIIVECVIEEDFYKVRESGSAISIPISLKSLSDEYYEAAEVKQWFMEYEYLLVYFGEGNGRELRNVDTGEIYSCEKISSVCSLRYVDILPIKDNKVDLENRYYEKELGYAYKYHKDYTEYISDGMSLDAVSENIRKLAKLPIP